MLGTVSVDVVIVDPHEKLDCGCSAYPILDQVSEKQPIFVLSNTPASFAYQPLQAAVFAYQLVCRRQQLPIDSFVSTGHYCILS